MEVLSFLLFRTLIYRKIEKKQIPKARLNVNKIQYKSNYKLLYNLLHIKDAINTCISVIYNHKLIS